MEWGRAELGRAVLGCAVGEPAALAVVQSRGPFYREVSRFADFAGTARSSTTVKLPSNVKL